VKLDWLAEAAAKKRKAPLKELKAWLELSCGSSWDSGGGSAGK
jgi:hypothetical protein